MANTEKPNLTSQIEKWSKYLGLVSGIVAIVTSLTGDPLIAYASLGILALIVGEYFVRVIFQKSPMEQTYHILLPSAVAQRGDLVYRYPARERQRAMIWLAGLLVLFLGGGSFNLWQARKPPVPAAREGESLIVVVQFQTNVAAELESDYAQQIFGHLDKAFEDKDIRIEILNDLPIKNPEAARKLGQRTNASLVIWGLFDKDFVYPQYEVLNNRQIYQIKLGDTPLQTQNKHLDFTLGTEIPQGIVYLTDFTIGQVYYLAGDYENALDYFDRAFIALEESGVSGLGSGETLDWGVEYVYFYRANTFANLGELIPAMYDYRLAIQKDPDFGEAYNNLGVGYSILGDSSRAIEQFALSIENGNLAVAYYNRGTIFYHQEDFEQATQDYSMAIQIEPQTPLFHQARADAYSSLCEYEHARDDLTTAIGLLQDDPDGRARALTNRGVAYTRLNENNMALRDYEQALKLNSSDASTYYNMAVTKLLMDDEKGAIETLLTAFQLEDHLKVAAACDPDLDSIRGNPRIQAVLPAPASCDIAICP